MGSENECEYLVRREEPRATGATWVDVDPEDSRYGGECYAEFAATRIDAKAKHQTCLFEGQLM